MIPRKQSQNQGSLFILVNKVNWQIFKERFNFKRMMNKRLHSIPPLIAMAMPGNPGIVG
jgi:hypothetical protein